MDRCPGQTQEVRVLKMETAKPRATVIPCLNESATLGFCSKNAPKHFLPTTTEWDVIVADNGSTDTSQIAKDGGADVVHVATRGYGAALNGSGIINATTDYDLRRR